MIYRESNYFPSTLNDGKHIFVFGSNLAGRHGAGAALIARKDWGAAIGIGIGRTGNAYAIPTKDRNIRTIPLKKIEPYIKEFITYAKDHPELTFLVTKVGCGLAGYLESDIYPMFQNAPVNCVLPVGWRGYE